jgi:hypothetical protein
MPETAHFSGLFAEAWSIGTDQILIIVTLCSAVVPWAISIHAKVSVIAQAMEGLPAIVRETRAQVERHAREIEALRRAAVTRS